VGHEVICSIYRQSRSRASTSFLKNILRPTAYPAPVPADFRILGLFQSSNFANSKENRPEFAFILSGFAFLLVLPLPSHLQ
jgi:hypothetical protein